MRFRNSQGYLLSLATTSWLEGKHNSVQELRRVHHFEEGTVAKETALVLHHRVVGLCVGAPGVGPDEEQGEGNHLQANQHARNANVKVGPSHGGRRFHDVGVILQDHYDDLRWSVPVLPRST